MSNVSIKLLCKRILPKILAQHTSFSIFPSFGCSPYISASFCHRILLFPFFAFISSGINQIKIAWRENIYHTCNKAEKGSKSSDKILKINLNSIFRACLSVKGRTKKNTLMCFIGSIVFKLFTLSFTETFLNMLSSTSQFPRSRI